MMAALVHTCERGQIVSGSGFLALYHACRAANASEHHTQMHASSLHTSCVADGRYVLRLRGLACVTVWRSPVAVGIFERPQRASLYRGLQPAIAKQR